MSEFFAQGGYAFFIWGAYGMAVLLLVIEVMQLRAQRHALFIRLNRLNRMRELDPNQ
ncbi:heme exporter protein CcmD [Chromatium okenii]|jgi:heme exporter protein D|uniref:Heme exporter protein D n=1 Tax=Chromatium okenii TaxID=61644 RepID=A0A2S7XQD0_9GAMM|nr:heme exporter protein CcmD [Chromatium okenii]PQJ95601.1 heme exporter protein CcmD [Chromatium okenii]